MPNSLFEAGFVDRAAVTDLVALQDELRRIQYEVTPGDGLDDTMDLALGMTHRYAAGIVHVDTGRLKNSLFTEKHGQGNHLVGHVATNVAYSIFEERRGGAHGYFRRTVVEEGPRVTSLFHHRVTGGQR
jgi:hypothetical protein